MRREVARPPVRVVPATGDEAGRLLDLARESMVTRQRDLDVFQWGDRRDVRLAHFPDGLTFVVIGAVPERRLLLESVYGFLTLKNGVPVGYVLVSALFGSSEIAYNVFETFRGGESGRIYGKVLALTRQLFGPDVFTIFPYQLGGYGNPEALASGAWWFYQKLGFRPRAPRVVKLMEEELARMKVDPKHRSSLATLKVLASENLYFHLGKERDDAIGLLELPNVGLAVTDMLARRFGSDRERAEAVLILEARDLLGLRSLSGWSEGERLAFRRWAPLVTILPGVARWSASRKARPRRRRPGQGRPPRVGLRAPLRPSPEAAAGRGGAREELARLIASARREVRVASHELLAARAVEVDGQLLGVAGALDRQDDARAVLRMAHLRAAPEPGRRGRRRRALHDGPNGGDGSHRETRRRFLRR